MTEQSINDHDEKAVVSVYTCIIYLGSNWIDISIYDRDGKLVRYERIEPSIKSIEVIGKYFRLNKSEFYKEVVIVCHVDKGVIESSEKVVRIF